MPPLDANGADASAEPSAAPSIEDDIRAAMAQLSAPDEPEPAAPEGAASEETTREDRARDERGRFAEKAEGEEPEAEQNAGAPAPAEGSKLEKLAPPQGWPADAKTQWDKLHRTAQEAIAADLRDGRLRLGGEASAADPVMDVAKPFARDAQMVGMDIPQYVKTNLEWARAISANPYQGIKALADNLGVDLAQLVPNATGTGSPETANSEVLALKREVSELRSYLSNQRVTSAQSEVDAWAGEKDASGSPLRPHYGALDQTAFAHRVALERQQHPHLPAREILQRAYDAEVYAQPTTRDLALQALRAADEAKRDAEAKAKAAEAARARSVSVRGSHSPAAGASADLAANETPEETVRRTLAALRN